MKKFNYGSMKWKKKREKILRKDGYKCVVAGWFGRTEEATYCTSYLSG